MVNHTEMGRLELAEAMKLREQAGELLNRLIVDREQSERRLAESGKRDPMKFVTGCTALESAIHSARELIVKMDELVLRIKSSGASTSALPSAAANGVSRPIIRSQPKPAQRIVHRPVHAVATP